MVPTVKFMRLSHAGGLPLPSYQTTGAAGADICAAEDFTIYSGESRKVPTGFAVEVPEGYELQIRSRSGLAAKDGIFVTNGVGTIDSDYRGEIFVLLTRVQGHADAREFKKGDRIAQIVLAPVTQGAFEEVELLGESERGVGGLGSTGI